MDRRLLSMCSLCRRAGALILGGEACEKAIKARKALAVIVCGDASDNTKKKFSRKAFYYKIPYAEALSLTSEELSRAAGVENRAVAVITDPNFSGRIMELVKSNEERQDD
jgi:ribosomal protein L7Ae-like RNA K-turn-binding protein